MDDKRERTRQQLVSAAIDVFHDNGFQNTRISDIVAKAGLAQGTFYLHFKSKEKIFHHICSEFKAMFLSLLDRSAADMFAGDCLETVRSSLQAFNRELIALFAANYKMAQLLFVEGRSHGGTFTELFESIYSAFIEKIVTHLLIGRERGHITFDDAKTEAAFLIGLFDNSLFYFLRIRNQIDIDALSVRMADFMLGGLSKRHSTIC